MTTTTDRLPTIPIPDYDDEQKRRNEDRSAAGFARRGTTPGYPCIVCGTYTGDTTVMYVHVCDGGGSIADPRSEKDADHDRAGCLAFYPIGGACLRRFRHLRPYAIKAEAT